MISEGYKKVCGLPIGACSRTRQISNDSQQWKDSLFQISRYDGDVLILSRNYLDDLHNRPPQELSAIHGLIENFGGRYSGLGLLGKHDVGIRAFQVHACPDDFNVPIGPVLSI
ncbi:Cytochrome P450 monooxygenase ltmK [Metarhizium anisopliae]